METTYGKEPGEGRLKSQPGEAGNTVEIESQYAAHGREMQGGSERILWVCLTESGYSVPPVKT